MRSIMRRTKRLRHRAGQRTLGSESSGQSSVGARWSHPLQQRATIRIAATCWCTLRLHGTWARTQLWRLIFVSQQAVADTAYPTQGMAATLQNESVLLISRDSIWANVGVLAGSGSFRRREAGTSTSTGSTPVDASQPHAHGERAGRCWRRHCELGTRNGAQTLRHVTTYHHVWPVL